MYAASAPEAEWCAFCCTCDLLSFVANFRLMCFGAQHFFVTANAVFTNMPTTWHDAQHVVIVSQLIFFMFGCVVFSGRWRSLVIFFWRRVAMAVGYVGGHTGGNLGAGPLPPARAGARPGVLGDERGRATAKPAEHGQGGRGE